MGIIIVIILIHVKANRLLSTTSQKILDRTPSDISGPAWAAGKKTPAHRLTPMVRAKANADGTSALLSAKSDGFYRWYPRPGSDELTPFWGISDLYLLFRSWVRVKG